jgi:hypothetical protein
LKLRKIIHPQREKTKDEAVKRCEKDEKKAKKRKMRFL